MKKIEHVGTNGKIALELVPENEEDEQEIYRLAREGKIDLNHSFGDYFNTTEEQDDKTGMWKKEPKK